MMKNAAKTVGEYLARVPAKQRAALQKIRQAIKKAAPKAAELISYGMPAFRHHNILAYYAAFKDHLSFFPGVLSKKLEKELETALKPFSRSKGTIRFTPEKPIPISLVTKIVKAKVQENETRKSTK